MQRKITDREIQKAQEIYLMQSKPFIDRLNEIHKRLTPKIINTETEVKVFYEETEEIAPWNVGYRDYNFKLIRKLSRILKK